MKNDATDKKRAAVYVLIGITLIVSSLILIVTMIAIRSDEDEKVEAAALGAVSATAQAQDSSADGKTEEKNETSLSVDGKKEKAAGDDAKTGSANEVLYQTREGYIRYITMVDKYIAVLEDGRLTLLDSDGHVRYSYVHSFSEPMIRYAENRILLYDRASDNYRVFDLKKELLSGKVNSGHILCADISDSGCFCIVYGQSDSPTVFLSVFSKNGKREIFRWKCSKEHIVCVALSGRGKRVSAGALSAENGKLISEIFTFDIKQTQTPQPYVIPSGAVNSLRFIGEKYLLVVTDENRVILTQENEVYENTMPELENVITLRHDNRGNSVVLTGNLKNLSSDRFAVFDKRNMKRVEQTTTGNVTDIAVNEGRVYTLTDEEVCFYNSKGELLRQKPLPGHCNKICALGRNAYCAGETHLYKISS